MDQHDEQHPWRTGPPAVYGPPTVPASAPRPGRPRRHRVRLGLATLALGVAAAGGAVVGTSGSASGTPAGTAGSVATAVPALDTTGTVASAAAAVAPGVVDVTSKLGYQDATAAGTGIVLTSTGEILTNNHVIDGATSVTVTVPSTGRAYPATVVGTDATQDVAVLQLPGASALATAPVGSSSSVAVGQTVVAIGNAGGKGGAPSVVSGTLTATGQSITASDESGSGAEQLTGLLETDAGIVAGDSGGPMVSLSGTVIGMDTAASSDTTPSTTGSNQHQGYAITIERALSVANQIESGQASSTVHIGSRGFLGVTVADTSAANGYGGGYDGTPSATGATVSGVVQGGAADTAGIAAGDVVTAVGGTAISSAQELTDALQQTHSGQQVSVSWTDAAGQTHASTVTLAPGPAD